MNRCYNKSSKDYKYYGGRGIYVCDEWKSDIPGFLNFYNWMIDHGWYKNSNLTIDRQNNNREYSPSNCTLATPKEQMNNTRATKYIQYNNYVYSLTIWHDILYELKLIGKTYDLEKLYLVIVNTTFNNKDIEILDKYQLYNQYNKFSKLKLNSNSINNIKACIIKNSIAAPLAEPLIVSSEDTHELNGKTMKLEGMNDET